MRGELLQSYLFTSYVQLLTCEAVVMVRLGWIGRCVPDMGNIWEANKWRGSPKLFLQCLTQNGEPTWLFIVSHYKSGFWIKDTGGCNHLIKLNIWMYSSPHYFQSSKYFWNTLYDVALSSLNDFCFISPIVTKHSCFIIVFRWIVTWDHIQ